jgi:hypothetical protein
MKARLIGCATRHLGLGQLAPSLGGVAGSEPAPVNESIRPNNERRILPGRGPTEQRPSGPGPLTLIEPDSAGGCYSCVP